MPKRNKILIYSPEFAVMGGIERHIIEVATLLLEHHFTVCLVSTSNSLDPTATQNLKTLGCDIHFLSTPSRSSGKLKKTLWLALKFWQLRKSRWNWIYTNGQGNLFPLVRLAQTRGTRIVHQHHTSADEQERKLWTLTYMRYTQSVDALLAVSDQTRDNIRNIIGRSDIGKLTCLYPWQALPTEQKTARRAKRADEPVRFFYAGRLIEEKGIDTILELSKSEALSDCEWHIWGSGPHYDGESFKPYPNVHYHGIYSTRGEFLEIAQKMDAFVLFTRHSEGLPISLLEVTELGIPWIASDRGGCLELALRNPDCQILPRIFSLEQAKTITQVLLSAIRHGQTDRAALKQAFAEKYHPEKVRQQWLRFFSQPPANKSRT